MKNADKNRDPERARKRATSDLRCAARKLGAIPAIEALAQLCRDEGHPDLSASLLNLAEAKRTLEAALDALERI